MTHQPPPTTPHARKPRRFLKNIFRLWLLLGMLALAYLYISYLRHRLRQKAALV